VPLPTLNHIAKSLAGVAVVGEGDLVHQRPVEVVDEQDRELVAQRVAGSTQQMHSTPSAKDAVAVHLPLGAGRSIRRIGGCHARGSDRRAFTAAVLPNA
jgi:hypothetical protein